MEAGTGARAPEPAPPRPRALGGAEKRVRPVATLATIEVGRGRASLDERQVDVPPPHGDRAQEPAEAIPVVQSGLALESHDRPDRREHGERAPGFLAVALPLALGRVDLDEPDPTAVGESQRVTVRNRGDAAGSGRDDGRIRPAAARDEDERRDERDQAVGTQTRASSSTRTSEDSSRTSSGSISLPFASQSASIAETSSRISVSSSVSASSED